MVGGHSIHNNKMVAAVSPLLLLAGLLPPASALAVAEVKQFPLLMPHARPAQPETYLCTTVSYVECAY